MTGHALVVRLDSMGDMLAAGPAIRAVAAHADRVTVLAGPLGGDAAHLLPGVADVVVWSCPWILNPAPSVSQSDVEDLVARIRALQVDQAVVLTSFHQSPLPTALLLRLAGVPWIAAVSEDYPGALLDVRLPDPGDAPEPVRMLQTVVSAGFSPPAGDHGRLAVRRPLPDPFSLVPDRRPYLVVHPGTSAPARAYPEHLWASAVDRLLADGWQVVLTGSASERPLADRIAGAVPRRLLASLSNLAGQVSLSELAAVLDQAAVTVVGNTGPAHLSAAVGTPVVSLFAPVVPAVRWAPFGVPVELLGDQDAPCRDSRWVACRIPGHPCLSSVSSGQISAAVGRLTATDAAAPSMVGVS